MECQSLYLLLYKVFLKISILKLTVCLQAMYRLVATIFKFPLEIAIIRQQVQNNMYTWNFFFFHRIMYDIFLEVHYSQRVCILVYFGTMKIYEEMEFLLFMARVIANSLVAQTLGHLFTVTSSTTSLFARITFTAIVLLWLFLFCEQYFFWKWLNLFLALRLITYMVLYSQEG